MPLADVPIDGGTDDERAVVQAALLDFEADAGPGRVEVSEVRIVESDTWMGKTNQRVVWIQAGMSAADTALTVRHELCHILTNQEDLVHERWNPLSRLTDGPLGSGREGSDEYRVAEVFANLCEKGPAVANALAGGCPDDPDGLWPLFAWLSDTVWTGEPRLGVVAPAVEHVTTLATSLRPTGVSVFPASDDPLALSVWALEGTDLAEVFLVDPYTGEDVTGSGDMPHDLQIAGDEDAEVPAGLGCDPRGRWGWDGGAAGTSCDVPLEGFGAYRRALIWDGAAWNLAADACMGPDRDRDQMFAADHGIWLAEPDGASVTWRLLYP